MAFWPQYVFWSARKTLRFAVIIAVLFALMGLTSGRGLTFAFSPILLYLIAFVFCVNLAFYPAWVWAFKSEKTRQEKLREFESHTDGSALRFHPLRLRWQKIFAGAILGWLAAFCAFALFARQFRTEGELGPATLIAEALSVILIPGSVFLRRKIISINLRRIVAGTWPPLEIGRTYPSTQTTAGKLLTFYEKGFLAEFAAFLAAGTFVCIAYMVEGR
jgi:hypothetical protein